MAINRSSVALKMLKPEESAASVMRFVTEVARALPKKLKEANLSSADFKLCATVGTGQIENVVFPAVTIGLRPERIFMPSHQFQMGIGCLAEVLHRVVSCHEESPFDQMAVKLMTEPVA